MAKQSAVTEESGFTRRFRGSAELRARFLAVGRNASLGCHQRHFHIPGE